MDLTGNRFGRLIVLQKDGVAKSRHLIYKCECDCGNIISVKSCNLKSGNTKSCGCNKTDQPLSAGQKIGSLTLIESKSVQIKSGKYLSWICRCDCGKLCSKMSYSLRENKQLNCRSLVHSHTYRHYPPTPNPIPLAVAKIAAKYLPWAQQLDTIFAEDIAVEKIIRGAWICYWREQKGFPVVCEKQYFAKIIHKSILMAKAGFSSATHVIVNKDDSKIGAKMTKEHFTTTAKNDLGGNISTRKKRKYFVK